MELKNTNRQALLGYLAKQCEHFFPDGHDVKPAVDRYLDEALARIGHCIDQVKMWQPGRFDYLHSSQYTIFLYYLANSIWRDGGEIASCTKLFYLNKALNGIDLFYEIAMPDVFFIGHSVGIVLAKASYGNYLVLYQNSTVGKNHGDAPELGDGVVLYPNTAVIGSARVADRSYISQGTSVINTATPGNCYVYQGESGKLVFKPPRHNILSDFFRSDL